MACPPDEPCQPMAHQELEKQYSPSRWSPRMDGEAVVEAHVREIREATEKAQAGPDVLLNVAYGDGEGEKMDIYLPPNASGAFPLFLYIHGGYWQLLSGIYLCGHSAGAHLAAMALLTDWTDLGLRPNLKGAFLVSGIYDLEPILNLYVNDKLHMTREVARRNSPQLRVRMVKRNAGTCEVKVALAQYDSPEFRRQSREFFEALRSAGWAVSLEDIAGVDHFDVVEKLQWEDYVLTQIILETIFRGPPLNREKGDV
ncbi:kynurenine formamidase isoform X2 [Tachyglossus aculeatus]|uniref:kynurenine formamidase isoform X2 n=1 Tax=Tachyglossus aculeatus TaxID=9261 RepID=UPI0018F54D7E|nr:kynurenine formamidase isoform X2 [Tachyglossus aculeatus]